MTDNPLGMFTPHHAGIVVSDLVAAMNAYITNLGYTFFHFEVNEKNSRLSDSSSSFSLRFGIGQLGASLIELIQPISGTTIYSRHLAQKGAGLHHLGFSTINLASAQKQFSACGYPCLQTGRINDLVDFSYYEGGALGCIIEPLQLSCDLGEFLLKNAELYSPPA